MRRAQMRRAARSLAISSKKSRWLFQKKLSRGANGSMSRPRRERIDVEPARQALLDVGESVRQRERQLLGGRRSRFTDVIARDRNGVPLRHVPGGELDQVDDDPQAGPRREAPAFLRDVFLENVILQRAAQAIERHARPEE